MAVLCKIFYCQYYLRQFCIEAYLMSSSFIKTASSTRHVHKKAKIPVSGWLLKETFQTPKKNYRSTFSKVCHVVRVLSHYIVFIQIFIPCNITYVMTLNGTLYWQHTVSVLMIVLSLASDVTLEWCKRYFPEYPQCCLSWCAQYEVKLTYM